jgi:cytochrome c oxidase assembly protein subunit 11
MNVPADIDPDVEIRSHRLAGRLAVIAMLMFSFGFAMVPIYQVVCHFTGLNGTTGGIGNRAVGVFPVDSSRSITVEFVAATSAGLPWEFAPDVKEVQVMPGQVMLATFHVRNLSNTPIVGQAAPSVTPHDAAPYFHKLECFCFTEQALAPGELRSMPVQFVVDAKLPPEIGTLTLSYTFFAKPTLQAAARRVGEAT